MSEEFTSSDHKEALKNHPIKVIICPSHKILVAIPKQDGPYSGMGREEVEVFASLIMLLGEFEGYLSGSREKGRSICLFPSQALPEELNLYVIKNLATKRPETLGRTMSKGELLEWADQVNRSAGADSKP